jgi:aminoglycoside phosphotransferase (APT) family kinase protein
MHSPIDAAYHYGLSMTTPAAEVAIDSELVAGLLADQHPDLAHLSLREMDAGWDNAMFRLGEELIVRLPRRTASAPLIAHEQTWLPRLKDQLTLPIPAPVRVGMPGCGYPWAWSVLPWLQGLPADDNEPHPSQAKAFIAFLRSLHVAAPADAPLNSVRGVPLSRRKAAIEDRLRRLADKTRLITPAIERIWNEALVAPIDVPPTWLHGDLHSRNVLVDHGVISGIIDWGDVTSGDCATDLASMWILFADREAREDALGTYPNLSAATLKRAKGWAVMFGTVLLDTGLIDSPRNADIGQKILQRLNETI